jgi:hypothetical protein
MLVMIGFIFAGLGVVTMLGHSASSSFSSVAELPPPPQDVPKKLEPGKKDDSEREARLMRNADLTPEDHEILLANAHLHDPFFWLVWVGGSFLGAWGGYWSKVFKDKVFATEVNTWTYYKRGAFIMVSFILGLGTSAYVAIELWPPPLYHRVLLIAVVISLLADVLMSFITSNKIRDAITGWLGSKLPSPPVPPPEHKP